MIIERIRKDKRIEFVVVLFVCLAMRSLSLFQTTSISVINDNVGDLALPTYLAGLDWSYLVAKTSYYGYGIKWLYTPLFWLTDSPYIIYMGIRVLYIVLEALMAVGVYFIVRGREDSEVGLSFYALVLAVIMVFRGGLSMNSEAALFMTFCLVCGLLLKSMEADSVRKKRCISIGISIFIAYMITLHERAWAVVIAFCVLVIFWRVSQREWIVSPFVTTAVSGIALFAEEKLTDYVTHFFWAEKLSTGKLKNTSVLTSNTFWFLESWYNFAQFFKCVLSNIEVLFLRTYGLAAVAFVLFVGVGIYMLAAIFKKDLAIKDSAKSLVAMLLFSLFVVSIILVGVAVRWADKLAVGNPVGYKGFSYHRYYLNFVWPGILAVICLVPKLSGQWKKYCMVISAVIFSGITFIYMFKIYPALVQAKQLIPNVHLERAFLWSSYGKLNNIYGLIFNIVLAGAMILLLFIPRRKMFFVALFLFSFATSINFSKFGLPKVQFNSKTLTDIYTFVEENKEKVEFPQTIYCLDPPDPYSVQFALNRYIIKDYWPEDEENAVVFSRLKPEELKQNHIGDGDDIQVKYFVLENGCYIYVQGIYVSALESHGYFLNEF